MKRFKRLYPAIGAILLGMLFSCNCPAFAAEVPFAPGEKLTYSLRWEFIYAGEATLEVLPPKEIGGVRAHHFAMTARSNGFIDAFYKVRDRVDAYVDPQVSRSLLYRKKQREGSHERDIVVEFDWGKKTAQYSNFGNPRDPIPLMPGTFDPLSAFYFARSFELKEGMVVERAVTDGKKNVMGQMKVVRREVITVDGKAYDTFLVEPDLRHVGGVFEKSKDAKIQLWLSADHRKIPVRIKSEVVVGSFIGELISDIPGTSSVKSMKMQKKEENIQVKN